MALSTILLGALVCCLAGWLPRHRRLFWVILSAVAAVWLQPASLFPGLRLGLPLLTILLVVSTWAIIRPPEQLLERRFFQKVFFLGAVVAAGAVQVPVEMPFSRVVALLVLGSGAAGGWLMLLNQEVQVRRRLAGIWMVFLIALLVGLKTPPLMRFLNAFIAEEGGSWQWLGISYLTLRLIALLIDFRADRLPPLGFEETLIYALFPVTLLSGPIDRGARFAADLRAARRLDADRLLRGARRIGVGLFKKFVLADSLALVALSPQLAEDTHTVVGAWIVAYLYAFQLFFDFSGYSDIAIGLGTWAGFDLPENFNMPYLRQNLAAFWQNWHMTLTDWFRSYFFLPLSRQLLRRKLPIPDFLVAQAATMTLIAFWHGVTVNLLLWGLWHAVGLYAHKLLADRTRPWYLRMRRRKWAQWIIYVSGVALTFHYVVMGWVFFALPEPALSVHYMGRMLGL